MKEFLVIWAIVLIICIYEAIWCTKWDPESEEYLRNREKNQKK